MLIRKRRNRHLTKQVIVKAVGEAIAQLGTDKAGINHIAEISGYNKVLIYRYFGGRNGLYEAYLSELLVNLENEVTTMTAPVEEVTYYVYTYLSKFAELVSTTPAIRKLVVWQLQNPEHSTSLRLDEVLKEAENRLINKLTKPESALVQLLISGIIFRLVKQPSHLHEVQEQLNQVFVKRFNLHLESLDEESLMPMT